MVVLYLFLLTYHRRHDNSSEISGFSFVEEEEDEKRIT